MRLDLEGVKIVGDVPGTFPIPQSPDFSSFEGIRATVTPAAILAVLGFIGNLPKSIYTVFLPIVVNRIYHCGQTLCP